MLSNSPDKIVNRVFNSAILDVKLSFSEDSSVIFCWLSSSVFFISFSASFAFFSSSSAFAFFSSSSAFAFFSSSSAFAFFSSSFILSASLFLLGSNTLINSLTVFSSDATAGLLFLIISLINLGSICIII